LPTFIFRRDNLFDRLIAIPEYMNTNDKIENNFTGESFTLLVSGKNTNGSSNKYQLTLPANHPGHPLHYHTGFVEIFTVEKGQLDIYTDKESNGPLTLTEGQMIVVKTDQPHRYANSSGEPVTFTVEARPAGSMARAYQVAYGVANKGGGRKDGLPANRLVRIYVYRIGHMYFAYEPLFLQRIVFSLVTFILFITLRKRKLDRYIVY